jgi:hypothetical protein
MVWWERRFRNLMFIGRMDLSISVIFEEARRRLAVDDEVLEEARKRRDLMRSIVEEEFATLRSFGSGSLAHGTQNKPLADADLGAVLDRRTYSDLGPEGEGPEDIAEEVRTKLRERLKDDYPKARFYLGGRRAIKVTFNEPVGSDAEDFTADLIVAVTRDEGGLWIPNLKKNGWDPSDPEKHTELIVDRNKDTDSVFARILRLAKHANARHGHTICSFNIEALGLESIEKKMSLPEGLALLLRHAADSLAEGLTEDPAGVSGEIKVNGSRKDAAKKFKELAELAEEALELDADGQTAQAQRNWSRALPEAIDPPNDEYLRSELVAGHRKGNTRVRRGVGGVVVSSNLGEAVPSGRAFGDKKAQTR